MRKNRISLFADREVNTGRQVFLDLAKVLAIMFMVSVHALLEFACLEDAEGGCGTWGSKWTLRILDDILGGTLSSSVFMFAMGVGVMYSRTPECDQ